MKQLDGSIGSTTGLVCAHGSKTMLKDAPRANKTKTSPINSEPHCSRSHQIQKLNHSCTSPWTLSPDSPTVKDMTQSSPSSTMDVLEAQYSYHVQLLSWDPKSPNYILTISIDGLDFQNESSVTETPNSRLTSDAHSQKN